MAYGDFKDLARKTTSDKVLKNKAFNLAVNPKYDEYQRGLASVVHKFFDKKSKGSGIVNIIVKIIMITNKICIEQKNYTNRLLETFKKEQFILDLKIIFGELI